METLLPMPSIDKFLQTYFVCLANKMEKYGYDKQKLIQTVIEGTGAMVNNDGLKPNAEVFWDKFAEVYGEKAREDMKYFDDFYNNEYDNAKVNCGFNPQSNEVIKKLKEKGYRLVIATNPIFPKVALYKRIKWAGVDVEDFEYVTTYEVSSYTKPNPKYYQEIFDKLNVRPEECLMVGNDVGDDMIAQTVGAKVFLLKGDLINKENKDISQYPSGSFNDLLEFIDKM